MIDFRTEEDLDSFVLDEVGMNKQTERSLVWGVSSGRMASTGIHALY